VLVNCSREQGYFLLLTINSRTKKSARSKIRKKGFVRCESLKRRKVVTSPAMSTPCVLLLKIYDPREKRKITTRRKRIIRGEI